MLAVDVTEFLRNPIRTGIQRVIRELLKHWPAQFTKELVYFDSDRAGFRRVSRDIADYCISHSGNPYISAEEAAGVVSSILSTSEAEDISLVRGDRVLIPELFTARDRIIYYKHLDDQGIELFPIVYDMLAWTSPGALDISYVGGLNDYLGFLFFAKRRAFISRSVHDVFYGRFLRQPSGHDSVIPLGSDSLAPSKGGLGRSAPYFICAGALDGRKRQDAVYRAFLASSAPKDLDLVFAGRVPPAPRGEMLPLISSTHPRIALINDPDDNALASLIEGAQASFFVSRHEGFGLPAVESLYLGTPVVVDAELPAVSNLSNHGQIRLQSASDAELVDVMNSLADPQYARALRLDIARLNLQTWASYAHAVAAWASS